MADGTRNPDQPMEATTPFDLNQAIQRWRENLGQFPAFGSESLFELETHLRDSIAVLRQKGLSDEEAFLVAAKRLGPSTTLETEFAKQNVKLVWLDRVLWILVGVQLLSLANGLSHLVGLLFNVGLPGLNSWLAGHGLGAVPPETAPFLVAAIVLPLILLSGAKLILAAHQWFRKMGKAPVAYLQQHPNRLTALFALLAVLPFVLSWGSAWVLSFYGTQRVYGSGLSIGWMYGIQATRIIMFSVLVLVIARKRQRLCRN